MLSYQFYWLDEKGKDHLVGILPERRFNPERITNRGKWPMARGRISFCHLSLDTCHYSLFHHKLGERDHRTRVPWTKNPFRSGEHAGRGARSLLTYGGFDFYGFILVSMKGKR